MAWFIFGRILGSLVGAIIARTIIAILNALGFYPGRWLAERVMAAPTEAWVEAAIWAIAAIFGVGGYNLLAWWKARRKRSALPDENLLDMEVVKTPQYIKNLTAAYSVKVINNGPSLDEQCLVQVEGHGIIGIPDPLIIRTEGQIRGNRAGRFTLSKEQPKLVPIVFRQKGTLQYALIGEDSEEYGFAGKVQFKMAVYAKNITKKIEISFDPEHIKYAEQWDDLETSAQYFYNELTSGRFNDAGQLRQGLKAFDGVWGGVSGWITDGIRDGTIKARGLCEMRTVPEPIPTTIKGVFDDNYPDGCVEDEQGLSWRITEINHRSLDKYLEQLESDDNT